MTSIAADLRVWLSSRDDVDLVVLFGSAARGEGRPDSDVDVGVIYAGDATQRRAFDNDLERHLRRELDVVDLDRAPPQLRFEIARDGVMLRERSKGTWTDFRARAFVDWWDFAPLARLFNRAAVARLQEKLADDSR